MLIDAHHHLWQYDPEQYSWINDEMAVLKQDFGAPELRQISSENGVDCFVSVQARQAVQDTRDLLAIADSESKIAGVVGWVPLASPDVAASLDEFSDNPKLKGVRHVVQDEPDDRFLDGREFNEGVAKLAGRGLVYDVLIFPRQLPAAIDFVDRHPAIPMVLDHIAKPAIAKACFDQGWKDNFVELAKRDNLTCKLSGIATEVRDAEWDIETMRPYFDIAMEAFGPSRMMFASDWPVCLLASEYSRWLNVVQELMAPFSDSEKEAFFSGTAIKAYGLEV